MLSQLWGVRSEATSATAVTQRMPNLLAAWRDGHGRRRGLNKDVIQVRSAEDAAAVKARVTRLLHRRSAPMPQCRSRSSLDLQAAHKPVRHRRGGQAAVRQTPDHKQTDLS